jgi:hypothetical protein
MELKLDELTAEELTRLEEAYWIGIHIEGHMEIYADEYAERRKGFERIAKAWSDATEEVREIMRERLAEKAGTRVAPSDMDVGWMASEFAKANSRPRGRPPAQSLRDVVSTAFEVWLTRGGSPALGQLRGSRKDADARFTPYPLANFIADVLLLIAEARYDKISDPNARREKALTDADTQLRALRTAKKI